MLGAVSEVVELTDVESFCLRKRRERGVIVMRRSGSGTSIHHPACPFVREDSFTEKRDRRGTAGYYWADSVETAKARWPLARLCGHPSDPLTGGAGGSEASTASAPSGPSSGATWEVAGPAREMRSVRAYADGHLPFEPRTDDLLRFRSELRRRLARLAGREGEILHATYFGPKPANADVENLLLYNVDEAGGSLACGRSGVRFEYAATTPTTATRSVTYLYRPAPRDGSFALWRATAEVARWPSQPLRGAPRRLADVWLALRQGRVELGEPAVASPIAVSVWLSPPDGVTAAAAPPLVKVLIDGAVAALQAHSDRGSLDAVSARLGAALGEPASVVAALLADSSCAVLGARDRLVHLRGDGVIFAPSDEMVVAGEVLIDAPSGAGWTTAIAVSAVESRAG